MVLGVGDDTKVIDTEEMNEDELRAHFKKEEPKYISDVFGFTKVQRKERVTLERPNPNDPKHPFRVSFTVRALKETEYNKCRERAINKQADARDLLSQMDIAGFRNALIYTATIEDDRKALWDNKGLWEEHDVRSGVDCVEEVLDAGDKEEVIRIIDRISGFGSNIKDDIKK